MSFSGLKINNLASYWLHYPSWKAALAQSIWLNLLSLSQLFETWRCGIFFLISYHEDLFARASSVGLPSRRVL